MTSHFTKATLNYVLQTLAEKKPLFIVLHLAFIIIFNEVDCPIFRGSKLRED